MTGGRWREISASLATLQNVPLPPGWPFAWAGAGLTLDNKHRGGKPLAEDVIRLHTWFGLFWGMSWEDKGIPFGNLFRGVGLLPPSLPGHGGIRGSSCSCAM